MPAGERRAAATARQPWEPAEVVTDRAPTLRAVVDELIPAAFHNTARYANNRIVAEHDRETIETTGTREQLDGTFVLERQPDGGNGGPWARSPRTFASMAGSPGWATS